MSSTMDSIIRKNARNDSLVHASDFIRLVKAPTGYYYSDKLYFFFDSELELKQTRDPVVYAQMKNDSIRHLIPYKGHYFDYTVRKEYNTLREWAEDNGKTVENIRYGLNKVYSKYSWEKLCSYHISLDELLKFLDPKYNGESVVDVTYKENLLAEFDFLLEQMNALRVKIEKLQ